MTVFFTLDAEAHKIHENADIQKAFSREQALDFIRRSYNGSDFEVIDLETGSFGDCWAKFYTPPSALRLAKLKGEAGDLIVQAPGEHPGGRAWWIIPCAEILVPVTREKTVE